MSERTVTKEEMKLALDAATKTFHASALNGRGSARAIEERALGFAVFAALKALGFTKA